MHINIRMYTYTRTYTYTHTDTYKNMHIRTYTNNQHHEISGTCRRLGAGAQQQLQIVGGGHRDPAGTALHGICNGMPSNGNFVRAYLVSRTYPQP